MYMYTNGMAKKPYTLLLEESQLAQLERLREKWRIPVSEQIRMGIDMFIMQRTKLLDDAEKAFGSKARTKRR